MGVPPRSAKLRFVRVRDSGREGTHKAKLCTPDRPVREVELNQCPASVGLFSHALQKYLDSIGFIWYHINFNIGI
ncbi:Uncharacterized protein dnm_023360 [Desulfonema magnum]|uniref:Uncharacterized protein n=1 Tax=Desulfonema magnum TaxID=45655 RepID=A0A975BIH6_9BACT|nr:Uncharacterized protein dnm_023360 [Desulfonema magnum]